MKVRTVFWLILVTGLISGFALLVAFIEVSRWFLPALVLLLVGLGLLIRQLRCPKCRRPILMRTVRVGGVDVKTWGGFPPRICPDCGTRLD